MKHTLKTPLSKRSGGKSSAQLPQLANSQLRVLTPHQPKGYAENLLYLEDQQKAVALIAAYEANRFDQAHPELMHLSRQEAELIRRIDALTLSLQALEQQSAALPAYVPTAHAESEDKQRSGGVA